MDNIPSLADKKYRAIQHQLLDQTHKLESKQYRLFLVGLPPKKGIGTILIEPNETIAKIKHRIKKNYDLNPLMVIELMVNGNILLDYEKFHKYRVKPSKDVIFVMIKIIGG